MPTPTTSRKDDRDPEAAKQRDVLRWLHTNTFSVSKPTTTAIDDKENRLLEERTRPVKKGARASAGDAVLNTSVSNNTRSKSHGMLFNYADNDHNMTRANGAGAKKSRLNATTMGIGKSVKQVNQMIAYTPPPKTDSPKVSPGSSGKKKCMPSHWSMYPQVVHGVIEEVIAASKDQELRCKLRKGLIEVIENGATIPAACELSNAVNSTLRRYYNFARDKLMEVLGGDNGLPANLKSYVHSKTTYTQLEQLIKNGPQNYHQNGLEVEEEEEDETIGMVAVPNSSRKLARTLRTPVAIFKPKKAAKAIVHYATAPATMRYPSEVEDNSETLVPQASSSVSEVVRKRRHFSGTTSQLRELLTKVLKKRFTGDLEKMVDVLTETIVKDQRMSQLLKRKNITLEYLLSAYNFVGRFVALERLVVVEEDEEPGYGEINESGQLVELALPVPSKLNDVDQLCLNLVNAFGSTRDACLQRTSLVKYFVGVSYKGSPEQKVQLRKCVIAMLVGGVSAKCAIQDHPTRISYALDYLKRCKEARRFLSANFSKLAEAVLKNKVRTVIIDEEDDDEEEGRKPSKMGKMMDDIGDGTSSVPEYLDDNCFLALQTFLEQLKAMNFPIVKNLVIWLTKFMLNVKDSDLLERFEWTEQMEQWLEKEKLVTEELH